MNTALTERYRPRNFENIIGQEHVVKMLQKYIELKLHMPIILNGPYGCGKTTLATIFATQFHSVETHEAIWQNAHPGVIKINAANKTGVKQITELLETVQYQPLQGLNKVYIIDEAHTLSHAAYNAFLETLEFLPSNTYFIFATTDKNKIIDPLRSRCFQLNLHSVSNQAIIARLSKIAEQENFKTSPEILDIIATHSNGSVRDAVKYLEQTQMINPTIEEVEQLLEIPSTVEIHKILHIITSADYEQISNIVDSIKAPPVNVLIKLIQTITQDQNTAKWVPVLQTILDTFEVIRFGLHDTLILKIVLSKATYVYRLAQGLKIDPPTSNDQFEHEVKMLFPGAKKI